MSDHDPPPLRDTDTDIVLSLEHGPLHQALEALRSAQDDIEAAKARLAGRHEAFAQTLRGQIRTLHATGTVELADQVAGLIRTAYWDHPELRVSDLVNGTGLSQRQVRQIAGPQQRQVDCIRCGEPTLVLQRSRSQTLAPRCDTCVEHDRAVAEIRAQPPGQWVDSLLDHLEQRLPETGCRNTLAHTERWALREGRDPAAIMDWARGQGGYCDCELLMNARLPPIGWDG